MSWPAAVALASAALNAVLGALALARGRSALYRSFAVLGFSFSLWSLGYLRAGPEFEDPFWVRLMFTPIAWLPAAGLSFFWSFTGLPEAARRWRTVPLYALAGVLVVLLWSGSIELYQYRAAFTAGGGPVFALGLWLLYRHWRQAADPDERNRRGYMLLAAGIAVLGGFCERLAGSFGVSFLAVTHAALMAYSLIVLAAIERHHLMDLGAAVGQAAALGAGSLVLSLALTGLAWLTRAVEGQLFLNFFALSLALLVALPPLWERVNRGFGRLLFAQEARRGQLLDELEARLEGAAELRPIEEAAAWALREAWGASSSLLWRPRLLRGLAAGRVLPDDLAALLAAQPQPVTAAALRRGRAEGDSRLAALLALRGAEAAAPVNRGGELVGALLAGPPAKGFYDLAALRGLRRLSLALGRAVRGAELLQGLLHADRLAQMGTLAAGIAHEVRNPLSAMLGAVEIQDQPLPEEEKRHFREILKAEVMRLDGILSGLLDYASPKPRKERCEWSETYDRVWRLLRTELADEVEVAREGERAESAVSSAHLQQILLNLIKNAARAARLEGGGRPPRVVVRGRADDGSLVLAVEDNGPGIPAEVLPQLFTPFATHSEGGTGLGLATVRRLAELYGGRAWAENLEGGRGARFCVELPRD